MGNLFAELKRRHIYRVAAAYAVVAWVLIQLVNNLAPIFELPGWIARAVVLLLVVGFPITLLIAWMRELAPADGTTPRAITGKLDWVLIAALIAVIALVSYQQLASSPGARTTPLQPGGISIAVLPFINLSSDTEQEFFSDGMTEEITSALAKISSLQVVARTSAFEYKGQNRNIQTISQALHASYVIEGSVRKAGTRVRITAQLIRADSGAHLWTENYDRELTDIFAVQEDIAQAIAGALRVPLGLAQGDTLVSNRTTDLDSYQQYLRARALYRSRSSDEARKVLEPLVVRDPGFAPAWGLLAEAYVLAPDKVEKAAREAIRLDSRNAPAYSALADMDSFLGKWTAGEDGFRRALALDPNEPDVLHRYSTRLGVSGRIKEALSVREKLSTLEPFVPSYNVNTARFMVTAGQTQAAIAILEQTPANGGSGISYVRNVALARAYAAEGRYTEAADTLLAIQQQSSIDINRSIEDAARLLRSAPQKVKSPETLPALAASLNFVYAYIGALDRVLENPERDIELHDLFGSDLDVLWQSESAPLRKTERFKKFVRDAGLYDYWRARGWPDLCRPMGANDFVCD